MGRISDDVKYSRDLTFSVNDFVIGTDFRNGNATKTYSWLNVFESFQDFTGYFCPFDSDIDSDPLYDYFGGTTRQGAYLIKRYEKNDIGNITKATLDNNPFVFGINQAWGERLTLNYI